MLRNQDSLTWKDFQVCERIGEGIYASVSKCINTKTQTLEVVKSLRVSLGSHSAADASLKAALREIFTLRSVCPHPNIVDFKGYFVDQGSVNIRLQHLDSDLAELISLADDPIEVRVIGRIVEDMLTALDFIHSKDIVIRDLKPGNILLSSASGRTKLADFGLAKVHRKDKCAAKSDDLCSREICTRWYKSIEALLGDREPEKPMDMWSAGLVIGELFNHGPIFPGISDINQLFLIYDALGQPTTTEWAELANLNDFAKVPFETKYARDSACLTPRAPADFNTVISGCLRFNPKKRLSASQALALVEGSAGTYQEVASWVHFALNESTVKSKHIDFREFA
jgi:serine/threonine protein kinase